MTVLERSRAAALTLAVMVGGALVATGCPKTNDVDAGSTVTTADERLIPNQDSPTDDSGTKKVFKEDQTDIKIGVGEKFGIRLPQNPSIGDRWIIVSAPDDSFVKEDGSSMKYDSPDPKPGEGGQIEFKFKAKKAGTTTVTFLNCYRCGTNTSVAPENSALAKRLTFTINVG